jgi:hypothetical protein
MAQKIIGAQHDFSYGEVDVTLKRYDEHPGRSPGCVSARTCARDKFIVRGWSCVSGTTWLPHRELTGY